MEWSSARFKRPVVLTKHGQARMVEREIPLQMVADLIETGDAIHKDERHLWIVKAFPERSDNLICAAVVMENLLVVKTIMHNWQRVEVP
ncbi:MAG: DUF4258 domain-containing protein [Magnetococcales bacterium]|nr:DUF4258 domain-containing protein [Magnetococcales bacterium]